MNFKTKNWDLGASSTQASTAKVPERYLKSTKTSERPLKSDTQRKERLNWKKKHPKKQHPQSIALKQTGNCIPLSSTEIDIPIYFLLEY